MIKMNNLGKSQFFGRIVFFTHFLQCQLAPLFSSLTKTNIRIGIKFKGKKASGYTSNREGEEY